MSIIPATWEAEIRQVVVQGQFKQEVSETPISTKKVGVVVPACDPSSVRVVNRERHGLSLVQIKMQDPI
jgi:hypothetical protein